MNAAKAKKNPAKVKGAVLIMILAVMTVLIILLAGSIAVVYSAHNRVELKFRENQAYYKTTAVESFYDVGSGWFLSYDGRCLGHESTFY